MPSEKNLFDEFLDASSAYICLVDESTTARAHLPALLAVALTTLYRTGARLPSIELPDDANSKRRGLVPGDSSSTAGYADADQNLLSVLDDPMFSWETWSWDLIPPYVEYERWEIVLELSNDLGEIYEDLLDYRAQLSRVDRAVEARWHVRFGFWSHTSDHIVNALRLLHPQAAAGGWGPSRDTAD